MTLFRGKFTVNNDLVYIWKNADGYWHVSDWLYARRTKSRSLTLAMNLYFN